VPCRTCDVNRDREKGSNLLEVRMKRLSKKEIAKSKIFLLKIGIGWKMVLAR
jgi:hypothetical protein